MSRGNGPFNASAYIRELVKEAGKDGISFEEIYAKFVAHGWEDSPVAKARIYASSMQEKTKGNISAGIGKQMFVSNEFAPSDKHLPIRSMKPVSDLKPNNVSKRARQYQKEVKEQDVFDYLTEKLGPASNKPTDHLTYVFLLDKCKTGQQIIDIYFARKQVEPTHWYMYTSPMEPSYTHIGLWSE